MTIWNRAGAGRTVSSVRLLLIASTAMTSVLGTAALAQTASAPPKAETSDTRGLAVEEIIVTAQKRAQNLQDVPISVSVVSGQTIVDQNYRSLQDLSRTQPAFSAVLLGRGVRIALRGVSPGTNAAFDQSVVTFIDDVYHGKARSSGSLLLDIDRIELLKGPQTTFFGNNAIGGAINVQTVRPKQDFSGSIRTLYGDHGEYAAEAIVNIPMSNTLAVRVAGLANGLDGYVIDRTGDGRFPHERNYAGRVTALWTPNDQFKLFLKAEFTDNSNRGGSGLQLVDCPPRAPFTTPGRFCPEAISTNSDTLLNYVRDNNAGQGLYLSTKDFMAQASLDLGAATLTSVSGYSGFSFLNIQDVDGTPLTLFGLRAPQSLDQFSQEFRLTSNRADSPLSYILGVYYQYGNFRDTTEQSFSFLSATINAAPPFAGLRGSLPFAQLVDVTQKEEIFSGFASLTWRPIDALSLTAGARISRTDKNINQIVAYGQAADGYGNITPYTGATAALAQVLANGAALGTAGNVQLSRSDSRFTPTANIQYKFSPRVSVYASYSEGFKAGGFNGTLVTARPIDIPFEPEYVTTYEAGFRSELFDRRLLFNATVFHSKYSNLQTSVFAPINGTPVSVVQNAASSVSQGVEVESKLAVSSAFSIGTALSFLDSHFKSFPNASPTAAQRALQGLTSQNLSGVATAFAPKFAATFSADFRQPIGDTLVLKLNATLFHQSSYFLTDQADPNLAQGAYDKVDVRAALAMADDRWEFSVVGKNITNQLIKASGNDSAGPGSYFFVVERPRSVVVQIRHKW